MHVKWYSIILLVILASPVPVKFMFNSDSQTPIQHSNAILADVPFFVRGPTVNMVTNESALIFWRTDGLANATVWYGLNESVIETVANTTLDTDHRVRLNGLNIDSKYFYKVSSNNIESPLYHFRTAPADGDDVKMIVIGDNRPATISYIQPEEFKQMAQMIIDEEPHIILMTGDYVLDVGDNHETNLAGWAAFTNISDSMGHYAPIYGVVGNHDTGAKTGTLKLEYFFDAFEQYDEPSTYFSFDYAGAHYILLDTEEQNNEGRITGDQYTWLVNDFESTNSPIKYVFGHRPMYPLSHLGDSIDSNPEERIRLQQLFEDNNVTAFICGHDHLFNRLTVNGVVHIITGGGGAPVYNTQWGGAYFHYVRIDMNYNHLNISSIMLTGAIGHNYQLPYTGPLEIALRAIWNGSSNQPNTLPEIYFSEVPSQQYYSWDSEENQTELTGIPNVNGQHTLEVYALDSDDVWYYSRFVFTTVGGVTTTPEHVPIIVDPLVLGGIAVAGVAVVLILLYRRRK
ncbi:MAG: metallophosphoesterase [Candidatus Odinarchaeota archaeon]